MAFTQHPRKTVIISTTAATDVAGSYGFVVLLAAVITTTTGNLTGFTGVTLPAGVEIQASLRSITLESGTIAVYFF